MKPDFNRLHLFYQVYRHSSIAKAARELFVTQSAVSQNLQKLEQELNLTLFHRLPKRLQPTAAGEKLYQCIMPFFSTLENNLQAINSSELIPRGLVRVGAPPVFGAEFLPAVIAEFRQHYPAVTFHLTLGDQSVISTQCRNNELDIALVDIFGNREEESWNLLQTPLLDEPLILAGGAAYVQQHLNDTPALDTLLKCQFITYTSQAPELTEWFSHHFDAAIRQFDIVLSVENVHAVINAVSNNLGLGIFPQYLVQHALQKKELIKIKAASTDILSRISLLIQPGRKPSVTESLFIDMIRKNLTGSFTAALVNT
jgi:DNA-binding transcriptional LysR family regulator